MKKNGRIIYSTNKNLDFSENNNYESINKKNQILELHTKRYKGNKIAVIIRGFVNKKEELDKLSKKIKKICGVGGSVKNGEIIIQGNIRKKISEILKEDGYKIKLVGG